MPDIPDDLQVLVHDGGPRLTDGCLEDGVFTGRVLNEPQQLETVAQGSEVKFVAPSGEHLLMVTDKYLRERRDWQIQPCDRCGLDELFDAPSDLIRATFPDLPDDSVMEMFTAFCGTFGGAQVVLPVGTALDGVRAPAGRQK